MTVGERRRRDRRFRRSPLCHPRAERSSPPVVILGRSAAETRGPRGGVRGPTVLASALGPRIGALRACPGMTMEGDRGPGSVFEAQWSTRPPGVPEPDAGGIETVTHVHYPRRMS